MGRAWNADSNFLGLMDGTVVRARAMVRVVESKRWDRDRLLRVAGTPIHMNAAHFDDIEATVDPHKGPAGLRRDDPDVDDIDALKRCVPILTEDLRNT